METVQKCFASYIFWNYTLISNEKSYSVFIMLPSEKKCELNEWIGSHYTTHKFVNLNIKFSIFSNTQCAKQSVLWILQATVSRRTLKAYFWRNEWKCSILSDTINFFEWLGKMESILASSIHLDFLPCVFWLKIEREYGSMRIDVFKVFSVIGKILRCNNNGKSTWSA